MDDARNSKNKKSSYRPRPPFAIVEGAGTDVWSLLGPAAVWVLLMFYKKFNGRNRSNLSVTYREVKSFICERVFGRAIWQLIGFGFIDVKRWGRLERNCSLYGLSDRWRKLTGPTNEDRRAKIGDRLKEIEKLKRERGGGEKRQRIAALRKSLFEA